MYEESCNVYILIRCTCIYIVPYSYLVVVDKSVVKFMLHTGFYNYIEIEHIYKYVDVHA